MSEIRDRRGRFSKMPETNERPPADSIANRIERTRADRAVGAAEEAGIPAVSGARDAVDVSGLGLPTAFDRDPALTELEEMQKTREQGAQLFAAWLQADPIGMATPVTTRIVVDGVPVHGAPVDPEAQAAFVEQVRANRAAAEEAIAAVDAENEGRFKCPI